MTLFLLAAEASVKVQHGFYAICLFALAYVLYRIDKTYRMEEQNEKEEYEKQKSKDSTT